MSRSTLRGSAITAEIRKAQAAAAARGDTQGRQENASDKAVAAATPRGAGENPHHRRAMARTACRWPSARPAPHARPRARTLFNWLGQDLTGWRCLDAF